MSLYVGPGGTERLGDLLVRELGGSWTEFRAAVAYAKMSGIDHLHTQLEGFATRASRVTVTVGIDQHGTSYEALAWLLDKLGSHGHELYVRYNPRSSAGVPSPTFHPKVWLFDDGSDARALIGSGNLTKGGLFTNYEVGVVRDLSRSDPSDRAELDDIIDYLDECCDDSRGDVNELTQTLLDDLVSANLVLSESEIRKATRTAARSRVVSSGRGSVNSVGSPVFAGEDVPPPPSVGTAASRRSPPGAVSTRASASGTTPRKRTAGTGSAARSSPPSPVTPLHETFCIHLSVASKTEIFLAKAPLQDDPAFFGLPFTGRTEPRRAGNPPQPQADPWPIVDLRIYDVTGVAASAQEIPVKMWQYTEGASANDDVRIYFGRELQDNIVEGSILVMERDPRDGVDYDVRIYAPGHPDFAQYDAIATESLPNSTRRYGWA